MNFKCYSYFPVYKLVVETEFKLGTYAEQTIRNTIKYKPNYLHIVLRKFWLTKICKVRTSYIYTILLKVWLSKRTKILKFLEGCIFLIYAILSKTVFNKK